MAVHVYRGTMPDALTPICGECGTSLCFDISHTDYENDKGFWDEWICQECNDGVAFNRLYYATMHSQDARPNEQKEV
jgi:hypothetical protein